MDLNVKRINWMGNIYQKFEAVCQEVDDIVGQDAVKYLENRVQNVGDSMKKLCSGVVHELLPFPNLETPAKYEAHSVALKKNVVSSVKSVGGGEDNNKKLDEENPINNFIKALQNSNAIDLANDQQAIASDSVMSVGSGEDSNKNGDEENPVNNFVKALQDSNAIDLANDQQAGAPDKHEHVNQVSSETRSDYLEVEDSYITQDEVGDDSREAAGVKKESMHASIEETAINSASVLMNLISVEEKEPVEFSIDSGSYSGSSDSVCGVSVRTKDSKEVVNQVSGETRSDYLEVEDSYITQDEVGDDSREVAGVKKESMHASIEETAINSTSVLMNLISVEEKEPVEFSIDSGSYSGSSDSVCGVSVRTKDSKEVNVEQDSCLIVEENNTNSSAAQVLNFTSLGEKELIKASLFSESSDVDKVDTGILAKVSPAVSSVSCERPITKTGPLCFKSSLISDSPYLRSQGSWSFEIESCKNNSGDVACCNSNSSMVHICCKSPQVAGQVMESHDGLVSSCRCQSKESNDESPVCSVESRLEDIQLNDDTKLGESCVFVDDSELHAVSCRAQKLRSYKKRIQDVFTSKKRLAKEYEQLAIWYGDTDMEPSQDLPRTLLPFRSRTHANSKHLQLLQASETEWELL